MADEKPVAKPSARQNIGQVVNEATTKTAVRKLIKSLLEETTLATATCEGCGGTMKVPVPDVLKQITGLTGLLEQAEGRPGQALPGEVKVVIERPAFG